MVARAQTCNDCYFRKNGLCALRREAICPTFRAVRSGGLERPLQAMLVERTQAAEISDALVAVGR